MDVPFWWFVVAGFGAQMVDGASGMAFGITSNAMLLALGVPPSAASAAVHMAEVATTGASGLSHLAFRNVDRKLFRRLILPGVLGAALGAYVLTELPKAWVATPVAVYLLVMGLLLLRHALTPNSPIRPHGVWVRPLGLFGGFCDAIGGGGWGPIVTTTLVARSVEPRLAIGSVNLAEFFVALTATAVFVATIGLGYWPLVAGLVLGGMLGAPLAAWTVRRLPDRGLMGLVGVVVVALSVRTLVKAVGA